MEDNAINPGDYIIVQRQGYTKLHKIKEKGTLTLGSFVVELDNAVGEKYQTTFQMKLKPGTKRLHVLEKVDRTTTVSQLSIEASGADNRNITDDGSSQSLTKDEIGRLKDESLGSCDIVGQLINNSRSFNSKTEYSQEKYMKKKEKKYFEYVQIRKPTLRLLAQMFYRQDPAKTMGVRIDDLAQILAYANVQADGNYLLYDSGSSGVISAAILNAIGAGTTGQLIHTHPGHEGQKSAVLALGFPQEQLDRCISVKLYSMLRCYYLNRNHYQVEGRKRKLSDDGEGPPPKKPVWQKDNERACLALQDSVDGVIVVSKEHPVSVVKELLEFLGGSRSLVVFNSFKEPLQDLYLYLKGRTDVISLRLSNSFMRNYQVLPERTHPEVNMNSSGYILTGFKLN